MDFVWATGHKGAFYHMRTTIVNMCVLSNRIGMDLFLPAYSYFY